MRKTVLITLTAMLGLCATATAGYYLPKPGQSCKTGYVSKSVRVLKRHPVIRHGRVQWWIVRHHGHAVWISQARCYASASKPPGIPTPTGTPAPSPTTPGAGVSYSTRVDPTFTQAAANPLAVTYAYSADAVETYNGVSTNLATTGQLPPGVLNLYSPTAPGQAAGLVCSMNVGGSTDGGPCPVSYTTTGTYQVTTQYVPNSANAVTETDTEQIDPYATSSIEQVSASGPTITITPQVLDRDGNPFSDQQVQITLTDVQSGQTGPYAGTGTLSFTETSSGGTLELVPSGSYQGNPLAVTTGDTIDVTTRYLGSAGYAASASQTKQTVAP